MTGNPFGRRTVVILVVVVSVSFFSAVLWSVFGPELKNQSSKADSFSRSALGYHALVSLLKELGVPTIVSRHDSGGKARRSALLIVAEPKLGNEVSERQFLNMVKRARKTLVVLPKWRGIEDPNRAGWLQDVELLPTDRAEEPLRVLGIRAEVVRADGAVSWEGRTQPLLARPPQLLRGRDFSPIVRGRAGTLLARFDTAHGPVMILSDPDVVATHGITIQVNAIAFLSMLDLIGSEGEAVVIDETLHGFGRKPSVFRALFDFPLLLATLQGLLTVVILLWAAMGRFGPPAPVAPVLGAGKEVLIGNTAALLAKGRHAAYALRRYLEQSIADVKERLHVPASIQARDVAQWLDRAATSRGLPLRLADLSADVRQTGNGDQRRIRRVAARVHRWKEEMIRGPDQHP